MLENHIEKVLNNDKYTRDIFGGAIAFDELPQNIIYPSCYVINNKPRKHQGEHWLAVFFDVKKDAYFFDSYGGAPSIFGLEEFLKKNSNEFFYNKIRLQGNSSYCGYYCILFLQSKARSLTSKFYSFFSKNTTLNDQKISNYINKFEQN